MRKPLNIHVTQFRERKEGGWEYALLRRRDDPGIWQGMSGGVRDGEAPAEAARRICTGEGGCPPDAVLYILDNRASLPVAIFGKEAEAWDPNTVVVPQLFFAVDWAGDPSLSDQHLEFRWCGLEEGRGLMRYQSQQLGLWELEERLRRGNLQLAEEGEDRE